MTNTESTESSTRGTTVRDLTKELGVTSSWVVDAVSALIRDTGEDMYLERTGWKSQWVLSERAVAFVRDREAARSQRDDPESAATVRRLADRLGVTVQTVKDHAEAMERRGKRAYLPPFAARRADSVLDRDAVLEITGLVEAARDTTTVAGLAQELGVRTVDVALTLDQGPTALRVWTGTESVDLETAQRVREAYAETPPQDRVTTGRRLYQDGFAKVTSPREAADAVRSLYREARQQTATHEELARRADAAVRAAYTEGMRLVRKQCAKELWDMVGTHGRANEAGLYLAAVTLDPSLAEIAEDGGSDV